MDELIVRADRKNLDQVLQFVDERLEKAGCSPLVQTQIDIAVEEIFVNIAMYAYPPEDGIAEIHMEIKPDNGGTAVLTLADNGVAYDPLAKEDPDVTLPPEKRRVGGLGIYMVKQSMDKMEYERKKGMNYLTLTKRLHKAE